MRKWPEKLLWSDSGNISIVGKLGPPTKCPDCSISCNYLPISRNYKRPYWETVSA